MLDDRVAKFHELLKRELQQHDPESSVFLDTANMGAGDVFPQVLREEVESADVLVVLLCPAWLKSDWCRKEYTLFSKQEEARNRAPRVLPLLWVETLQLKNPEGDEIAKALSRINYQDFEYLRHFGHDDPKYSQGLAELAKRVVKIADRRTGKTPGDDGSTNNDDEDQSHEDLWVTLEQPVLKFLKDKEQLVSVLAASLRELGFVEQTDGLIIADLVSVFSGLNGEELVEVLDVSSFSLCEKAQDHLVRQLGVLAEMLLPAVVGASPDVAAIRQHRPCDERPAIPLDAYGEVGVETKMATADEKTPTLALSGGRLRSPHDLSPDVEPGLDEVGDQQISDQLEVIKHYVALKKDGPSASGVELSSDDMERTGSVLDKQLQRNHRRSRRRAYARYQLKRADGSGKALRRLSTLLPSLRLVVVNPDVQSQEYGQLETIAQIILAAKSEHPCKAILETFGGISE